MDPGFYKSIFTHSSSGMAILDVDGLVVDVNPSWEQAFGYGVSELKRRTFANLVGGEFLKSLLVDLSGSESWRGGITYRAKSGIEVECGSEAFSVVGEGGGPIHIIVNSELPDHKSAPLTEAHNPEAEREVLDSTVEAIFAVNRRCVCTLANRSFKTLLGYGLDAPLEGELNVCGKFFDRKNCADPEISGPSINCVISQSMEEGSRIHTVDSEVKRVDGTGLRVELWVNPIFRSGECSGAVITFFDNSQRENILIESEQHQRQLLLADKMTSLGIMVSGVAHEINNPNNFIMLNSQTLLDIHDSVIPYADDHFKGRETLRLGRYPYKSIRKKGRELLTGITEGSKRIERIVKKLKDFARTESEEGFRDIDINDIVMKAVELMQSLINKSTHFFSVKYMGDLPLVRGSYQEIEQVIINLISNSCDALSGPEKKVEIFTFYQSYEKSVCVMVTDEGAGISDENIGKIMDPFFTLKRERGGTGLGLSVSYTIVKKHGGTLDFSSAPELGTIAILSLPVPFEYGYVPGERYEFK